MRLSTLRQEYPNILLSYGLTFIRTAVFVSGNWIFFWLRFMTYGQLGIVDALSFGFGLIMEIPTGAISDMIGKRYTMIAGMLLVGVGFFMEGVSANMGQLVIGFWICQVGWAFMSGADDALVYDSLKEHGAEDRYARVLANGSIISTVSLIASAFIGALMYNISPGLPHTAMGILHLVGILLAFRLVEPKIKDVAKEKFTLTAYRQQLSNGFRHLVTPALRGFLPIMFGLLGMSALMRMSLVQPALAVNMGFGPEAQSAIFALQLFVAMFAANAMPFLRRHLGDWVGLVLITIVFMVGMWGAAWGIGFTGLAFLIVIRIAGDLANPWVSVIINKHIPSKDRSTTLSTVSLFGKLPYVLTAVIAGDMAERNQLGVFNLGVIIFLVLMLGLSLAFLFRSTGFISAASIPEEGTAIE
jgi:MFS family permease